MGFSTTYRGRLDITPRLNAAEVEWLTAYAELDRRYFTDPYEVPTNPRAFLVDEERRRSETHDTRRLKGGRRPRVRDARLLWDSRTEKSRMAEAWLQYLIDHFLRLGAIARTSGRPDFDPFTFDHVVSGVIAAAREDTRELWLIRCEDNEISTEQLVAPDLMPWDLSSLR